MSNPFTTGNVTSEDIDAWHGSSEPTQRRCTVCERPRLVGTGADAIAHAPCDQRIGQLDPDRAADLFWGCIGAAG